MQRNFFTHIDVCELSSNKKILPRAVGYTRDLKYISASDMTDSSYYEIILYCDSNMIFVFK